MENLLENLISHRISENFRRKEEERRALEKLEASKQDLLLSPSKVDELVSEVSSYFSPSAVSKPETSEYATKSLAVEATKDRQDPTFGLSDSLRNRFINELANPQNRTLSPKQILAKTTGETLLEEDKDGIPLIEKVYRYKRSEDASIVGGAAPKDIPGYQEWLKDKRAQEELDERKSSLIATPGDVGMAASMGALTGLVFGGPALAATFGISSAIGEMLAAPVRKTLEKTEWYKAKMGGGQWGRALGASIVPDIILGGISQHYVDKGIKALGTIAKAEARQFKRFPQIGFGGENYPLVKRGEVVSTELEGLNAEGGNRLYPIVEKEKDASTALVKPDQLVFSGKVLPETEITKEKAFAQLESPPNPVGLIIDKPFSSLKMEAKDLLERATTKEQAEAINRYYEYIKSPESLPFAKEYLEDEEMVKGLIKLIQPNRHTEFEKAISEVIMTSPKLKRNLFSWASDDKPSVGLLDYVAKPNEGLYSKVTGFASERVPPTLKLLLDTGFKDIVNLPKDALAPALDSLMYAAFTGDSRPLRSIASTAGLQLTKDLVNPENLQLFKETIKRAAVSKLRTSEEFDISAYTAGQKLLALTSEDAVNAALEDLAGPIAGIEKQYRNQVYLRLYRDPEKRAKAAIQFSNLEGWRLNNLSGDFKYASLGNAWRRITRSKKEDAEYLLYRGKDSTFHEAVSKTVETAEKSAVRTPEKTAELNSKVEEFISPAEESLTKSGLIDEVEETTYKELSKTKTSSSLEKLGKGMLAFGVTTAAIEHFSDDQAQASVLNGVAFSLKNAFSGVKEAEKTLLELSLKKGFISKAVTTETAIAPEFIQSGIPGAKPFIDAVKEYNPLNATKSAREKFKQFIKGTGDGAHFGVMTPYQAFESILASGKGKMINPAVFLQSYIAASNRNTANVTKIVSNILQEAEIKVESNQLIKEMEDLIPLAIKSTKEDILNARLDDLEKRLKVRKTIDPKKVRDVGYHSERIKALEEEIKDVNAELGKLTGAGHSYSELYVKKVEQLAKRSASVRISLALDDTPDFQKYPFLKGMLSYKEEVAAAKIANILDYYKGNLNARDIKTIGSGYFPHAPHPKFLAELYKDLGEAESTGGIAYAKFYHRTANSRPLILDPFTAMSYYIRDTEKRLAFHDFWKGPEGWKKVMNSPVVKANYGLSKAFRNLYEGSTPRHLDNWDELANAYTEIEVVKRLMFSASSTLKHIIKGVGDVVSVGLAPVALVLPKSLKQFAANITYTLPDGIQQWIGRLGVDPEKFLKGIEADYTRSLYAASRSQSLLYDLGLEQDEKLLGKLSQVWRSTRELGGIGINLAELFDRNLSINAGLAMAATKGMTVEQAVYGSLDLILKNNFLGGPFNSALLNNPKFRALLLFQSTPAKIFERRMVSLYRSKRSIDSFSKELKNILKERGWKGVFEDLKGLKDYMLDAESEVKSKLMESMLSSETDFFGTSVLSQMFRDVAIVALATYSGYSSGVSLYHHFFHVPYLSTQTDDPTLAISPGVNAMISGFNTWKRKKDDSFLVAEIIKKWAGPSGPLPDFAGKIIRISKNDIPKLYRQGGQASYLQYLFAIPSYRR